MIKIIKLTTGEEIMGDVNEDYAIREPAILQMVPSRTDPNKAAMALIPYSPYSKNNRLELNAEHIIWESEPVEELYNQYNSIFGSGIQIAR
jgi:hypothetical protein